MGTRLGTSWSMEAQLEAQLEGFGENGPSESWYAPAVVHDRTVFMRQLV